MTQTRYRARVRSLVLAATLLALACTTPARAPEQPDARTPEAAAIAWRTWGRAAFDEARSHDKIILVHVVAHWCHWCHVMEETTYADPEVTALLAAHFVTIRVDSDARPDVAERYRRWGWPATAFLTPDAEGVLELRGYRKPAAFADILRELVAERDAGTLARKPRADARTPVAGDYEAIVADSLALLDAAWDEVEGGWGSPQKYPWPGLVELGWLRGEPHAARADLTLDRHRALLDPVWGGMFQYSVGGVWTQPHYEKIAMIQAGAIETFAHAYMREGDAKWLAAAHEITRYLLEHMQDPGGGFWTSQDADVRETASGEPMLGADFYALDDAGRRAVGKPWTDTHVYADLNGLIIEAMCELVRAQPDPALLAAAIAAAERLLRTHREPSGGFRHGETSVGPLHLADQVALGRAFFALHRVTQEPRWLALALEQAEFIERELAAPEGGYFAHQADPEAVGEFARRRMPPEENAAAARLMLDLHGLLDGDGSVATPWRARAEAALRAVATPERLGPEGKVITRWLFAVELARGEALDVTVVGELGDAQADALWQAALGVWQPRASFERSKPGVRYPAKGGPAVYACTTTSCSPPLRDAAALREAIGG